MTLAEVVGIGTYAMNPSENLVRVGVVLDAFAGAAVGTFQNKKPTGEKLTERKIHKV